jgi:hypothetical protein
MFSSATQAHNRFTPLHPLWPQVCLTDGRNLVCMRSGKYIFQHLKGSSIKGLKSNTSSGSIIKNTFENK